MNNICRAIVVFPILLLGVLAQDKGFFATFGLNAFVAACIFFPPERYSGVSAGKKKWVVTLGVVALFVVFVAEANIARSA